MDRMDRHEIKKLAKILDENILKKPFPSPYPPEPKNIKAILLGCDPTNGVSDEIPYVFGIKSNIPKFNTFLNSLESNLIEIGLTFETVFSQNLCRNYFKDVTFDNLVWKIAAEVWIPILKEELEEFDKNIPVLLSSDILYNVLLNTGVKKNKTIDYYRCNVSIPVPPENNKLDRPLIPFYRNRRKTDYHLSNPEWIEYKKMILSLI